MKTFPINKSYPYVKCSKVYSKIKSCIVRGAQFITCVGSSRSTKTYSILQNLIELAVNSDQALQIVIIRSKLVWLKDSAFKDFKDLMLNQYHLWNPRFFSEKRMEYTLGKSVIKFVGLDKSQGDDKARGIRSHVIYFNEVTELSRDAVDQIITRNEGGIAIFDFNPSCSANHYIFRDIIKRKRSILLHSTYLDNPFMSDRQRYNIECKKPTPENIANGTADEAFWKIFGEGVRADIRGRIYEDVTIIKNVPGDLEKSGYAQDFGFTEKHPAALVFVGIKGANLYLDEIFCEDGLICTDIPGSPYPSIEGKYREHKISPHAVIYADNAEPNSIKSLKLAGYNIKPCTKGSVVDGITTVKKYKLHVTERSLNAIKEFELYKWAENKDGSLLPVPVKAFDHCLDGLRYYVMSADKIVSKHRIHDGADIASAPMQTGADKYDMFSNTNYKEDEDRWLKMNVYNHRV